mmetsp:Transcript_45377/g.140189  ORF Transcript_45377/g.140189 Transcript_45377/m.140189 type:complete len:257 (+) Transcript_45377:496-1266(+)
MSCSEATVACNAPTVPCICVYFSSTPARLASSSERRSCSSRTTLLDSSSASCRPLTVSCSSAAVWATLRASSVAWPTRSWISSIFRSCWSMRSSCCCTDFFTSVPPEPANWSMPSSVSKPTVLHRTMVEGRPFSSVGLTTSMTRNFTLGGNRISASPWKALNSWIGAGAYSGLSSSNVPSGGQHLIWKTRFPKFMATDLSVVMEVKAGQTNSFLGWKSFTACSGSGKVMPRQTVPTKGSMIWSTWSVLKTSRSSWM